MALTMFAQSAFAGSQTDGGMTISDTSLPQAQRGVLYSFDIKSVLSGGTGPYTFALTTPANSLPDQYSLSSSGVLSGVNCTTANGSNPFSIRITDGNGNVGNFDLSINMTAGPGSACNLTFSPSSLSATIARGTPWSTTVTPGGTSPYTYTLTGGALPAGLSLTNNGSSATISGIPTTVGTYNFSYFVIDGTGNSGVFNGTITVYADITISPSSLPNGTNGTPYTQTLTTSGGSGAVSCSVTSGTLPPGLSYSGLTVSGTPTTAGTYNFTVTCTDGTNSASQNYSITIAPGAVLTLNPASLPNGTFGTAYNQTVTASGGTGTGYGYVLSTGSLPAGLTLNASTGAITGSPTATGSFTFTVRGTDSAGNWATRDYTMNIVAGQVLTLSPTSLPDGTNGTAYSQTVTASGGSGTGYVYSIDSGNLPTGLSLNTATGAITGTPTTAGSYTFTVRAVDSLGNWQTRQYTVAIGAGQVLTLNPASLPNGTNGTAYSQSVSASGGTGTGYTYALATGSLPTGLSLNTATGAITGTPTTAGTYSFTIRAQDSGGNWQTRDYSITIAPGQILTLNPASLPDGTNGTAYSQTVTATGGTGTGYVYSLTTGTLPAGLSLNTSTGVISGTPTTVGSSTFTVRAVDSAGNYQTRQYTIAIAPGAVLTVGPATLASPTQGIAYSNRITASGGSGTGYQYALTSGSLPAGLTLDPASGAITGKTFASGSFPITVRVTDSQGNWGTRTYTLTISERPDPTLDNEVKALLDGQFSTASRFASGQINNAMHHMESLHAGMACGLDNKVTVSAARTMGMPGSAIGGSLPGSADAMAEKVSGMGGGATTAAGGESRAAEVSCEETNPRIALWAAGSIDYATDQVQHFNADALTFGLDWRVADPIIVGAAAGFGWNDSRIGTKGTRTNDSATTGMLYASIKADKKLFLDMALGKTWVNLAGDRFVNPDSTLAAFKRKGGVTFGSATFTYEQPVGALLVAGSLRYDYLSTALDQYAELGSSPYSLTYMKAKQTTQDLIAGLRVETTWEYNWGSLKPQGRAELRHHVSGNYEQAMAYSDLLSRTYTLHREGETSGAVTLAAGLEANIGKTSILAEYGTSSTAENGLRGGEARISVRQRF